MKIQYGFSDSSTSSTGKIGFLTLTVASFAFSGFTGIHQGYHALDENINLPAVSSQDGALPMYPWEALLRGTDSSGNGGEDLYISDASNFQHIFAFVHQLLGEQSEISTEFDKVFADSFWDILA